MIRFPARLRKAVAIACLILVVWKFLLGGEFTAAPATIESYVLVLILRVEFPRLTSVAGMLQASLAGNPLSPKMGMLTFTSVAN
jgi:hypothetical protein